MSAPARQALPSMAQTRPMPPLTDRQVRILRDLEWASRAFAASTPGALLTSDRFRVRDGRALQRRRLAEDAGRVLVVDGDGATVEPERYRRGYTITEKGRALLTRLDSPSDD